MKILYVEDELSLAMAVEKILRQSNYSVDVVHDGEDGLNYALTNIYDIIILDIMLPKKDGLSVMKEFRRKGVSAPVILLTARDETADKILGLDSGADDYLPKPFQTGELLARLRALSRRKETLHEGNTLRFHDIELNPHTLDLYGPGKPFHLTLKESQLLELLINNSGIIISSNTIIEKVWGYDSEAEDRHVQVYIAFLRKKLSQISPGVRIQTVRGAGYVLRYEQNEGEDGDAGV